MIFRLIPAVRRLMDEHEKLKAECAAMERDAAILEGRVAELKNSLREALAGQQSALGEAMTALKIMANVGSQTRWGVKPYGDLPGLPDDLAAGGPSGSIPGTGVSTVLDDVQRETEEARQRFIRSFTDADPD